jgi:hypothetical protein
MAGHAPAARQARRRATARALEGGVRAAGQRAGAGPGLFPEVVAACAGFLEGAGDGDRAAQLLLDAGLMSTAAQAAERAGDLEVLEQSLQGSAREAARAARAAAAFSRYESAWAMGRYAEAGEALAEARAARPDNRAYDDLLAKVWAGRPAPPCLTWRGPGQELTVALAPAWVGRGEDCALRLALPGLSRHHVEVRVTPGEGALLTHGERCAWHAVLGTGLGPWSPVRLGALSLDVRVAGGGVEVRGPDPTRRALVVPGGEPFLWDVGSGPPVALTLAWPAGGFPRWRGTGARLDGEALGEAGRDGALGSTLEVAGVPFRLVR